MPLPSVTTGRDRTRQRVRIGGVEHPREQWVDETPESAAQYLDFERAPEVQEHPGNSGGPQELEDYEQASFHGHGNVEDGTLLSSREPPAPDCPCRGTYKQIPCAKFGCACCRATVHQLQRVVCAARRNAFGRIICAPRHLDRLMREQLQMRLDAENWADRGTVEQGFVDQFGNFLTREEAHVIASANGQIAHRCGGDAETLYSENLY